MKKQSKPVLRGTVFSAVLISLGVLSVAAPVSVQADAYKNYHEREFRHNQDLRHEQERRQMRRDVDRGMYDTTTYNTYNLRPGERFQPIELPPKRVHIVPGFN